MNSLREIIESSPTVRNLAFANKPEGDEPQALAPARWDWSEVRRILVVRLRSIGDTVLTTPSLFALRRFLPHAQIDILLEDWVAPVLEGSDLVDRVIAIPRHSKSARARLAREHTEKRLSSWSGNEEDFEKARAKLERSMVRLQLATKP